MSSPNSNPPQVVRDNAALDLLSALVSLMFAGFRATINTTAVLGAAGARGLAAAIRRRLPTENAQPHVAPAAAPPTATAPPPPVAPVPVPFDPNMLVPHGVHHPPTNGRYYVVTTGTRVGIFLGWPETAHHVVGVSASVYHAYGNLADAQAAFIEALYAGVVRIVAAAGQAAGYVVPPATGN